MCVNCVSLMLRHSTNASGRCVSTVSVWCGGFLQTPQVDRCPNWTLLLTFSYGLLMGQTPWNLAQLGCDPVGFRNGFEWKLLLCARNSSISHQDTTFHTWIHHFTPGYNISHLGTAFHTWIQQFAPRYSILHLDTAICTWIQRFTPGYNISHLDTAICT